MFLACRSLSILTRFWQVLGDVDNACTLVGSIWQLDAVGHCGVRCFVLVDDDHFSLYLYVFHLIWCHYVVPELWEKPIL